MKGILFNTEMVCALLSGKKTVTRRVVQPQPCNDFRLLDSRCRNEGLHTFCTSCKIGKQPPYHKNDILYVRETWKRCLPSGKYIYKADGTYNCKSWRPSIYMPKEAARIFLKVTNVQMERLQDIITDDYTTPQNIRNEGVRMLCHHSCKYQNGKCKDYINERTCSLLENYISLWNSTIKPKDRNQYGWDANPWVWVIEFDRILRC